MTKKVGLKKVHFEPVKVDNFVLTPKFVEGFRDMKAFKGDRKLKKDLLLRLEHDIREGNVLVFNWAVALLGNEKIRVNGKHSSYLLSTMPDLWEGRTYRVTLSYYRCGSIRQVAALYSRFDSRVSVRSTFDVMHAHAVTCPEFVKAGIKDTFLSAASCGIPYAECVEGYTHKYTTTQRATLVLENKEFVLFAHAMANLCDKYQDIGRGPVIAAMYLTWKKNASEARKFWSLVASAEGPKPCSPDRKLNTFLVRTSVSRGTPLESDRSRGSHREFLCRCIYAWNAWRNNITSLTNLRYYASKPVPKVV